MASVWFCIVCLWVWLNCAKYCNMWIVFRPSDWDDLLAEAREHIPGLQCGGAEGWGGGRAGDLCPGHPARWHCCKVSLAVFWGKHSLYARWKVSMPRHTHKLLTAVSPDSIHKPQLLRGIWCQPQCLSHVCHTSLNLRFSSMLFTCSSYPPLLQLPLFFITPSPSQQKAAPPSSNNSNRNVSSACIVYYPYYVQCVTQMCSTKPLFFKISCLRQVYIYILLIIKLVENHNF